MKKIKLSEMTTMEVRKEIYMLFLTKPYNITSSIDYIKRYCLSIISEVSEFGVIFSARSCACEWVDGDTPEEAILKAVLLLECPDRYEP